MSYAELQVTTNYSFLRGGSHPGELVFQAASLGHYAIGIADRNTLAGVVRAYSAIKDFYEETGIPEEQWIKGQSLGYMTWASLALVIVLGSATLLTHDPRFVLAKPAIGHFAIGAIMLKRGWMLRYLPAIVTETIPEYVTFAGYAWAALMFVLGAGTIGIAMTGDMKLWTFYVTVVLVGAKIAAFAIQYIAFRILVGSRLRAAAQRA